MKKAFEYGQQGWSIFRTSDEEIFSGEQTTAWLGRGDPDGPWFIEIFCINEEAEFSYRESFCEQIWQAIDSFSDNPEVEDIADKLKSVPAGEPLSELEAIFEAALVYLRARNKQSPAA